MDDETEPNDGRIEFRKTAEAKLTAEVEVAEASRIISPMVPGGAKPLPHEPVLKITYKPVRGMIEWTTIPMLAPMPNSDRGMLRQVDVTTSGTAIADYRDFILKLDLTSGDSFPEFASERDDRDEIASVLWREDFPNTLDLDEWLGIDAT